MRSLGVSALLITLLAAAPGVASAQAEDAEAQAHVLYERARERYDSGDFERSAVLLQEALSLHDAPALHYNLAKALQELGRWEQARAEYVRYLEGEPNTPQRERVEARVALLDERIAAARPEPVAPVEPTPAPPQPAAPASGGSFDAAPWAVAIAGVVALGAAAPFAVLFDDAVARSRAADDHRAAAGPADDATTYAIVADVLFAVGGVTAAAGLVWGIVSLTSSGDEAVEVSLGPGSVVVRGQF